MSVKVISAHLKVTPQDRLVFEAVQIGEIEARDAFVDLIMEATIAVDKEEIDRISKIPEVVKAMGETLAPAGPKYGGAGATGDWRAKVPEIRKMQWKQKPIIDYIASANKEAVIEAVMNKFAPMPPEWRAVMFGRNRENIQYAKEARALQLSTISPQDVKHANMNREKLWPDNTGKWKYVYVQVTIGLSGFTSAIGSEAQKAMAAGQMLTSGEGQLKWQSTLTGFDAVLRELDPYSGAKLSDTKVGSWDVADEPGYDLDIRSGILDRIQEALVSALDTDVSGVEIDNSGAITFSAAEIPDESTEQDAIAKEMDPEATQEIPQEDPSEHDGRMPEVREREEREDRERKEREANELGDDF